MARTYLTRVVGVASRPCERFKLRALRNPPPSNAAHVPHYPVPTCPNCLRFQIEIFCKIHEGQQRERGQYATCRARYPMIVSTSSFRHLLFLLWPFDHFFLSRSVAVAAIAVAIRIGHLIIGVATALVILIELLANLGLGFGLEVFVNALVVLVRTSPVSDFAITRSEVFILKCCGK